VVLIRWGVVSSIFEQNMNNEGENIKGFGGGVVG
jgi:hypothetical protein